MYYRYLMSLYLLIVLSLVGCENASESTLEGLAKAGDVQAQYQLARQYHQENTAESLKNAIYWYRQAGEQGNVKAQVNLGVMYIQGQGVEKDYTQGLYWSKKAGEQGDAIAQYHVAHIHSEPDYPQHNQ